MLIVRDKNNNELIKTENMRVFVLFVQEIVSKNNDQNMNVDTIDKAMAYIKQYCPDLTLSKTYYKPKNNHELSINSEHFSDYLKDHLSEHFDLDNVDNIDDLIYSWVDGYLSLPV